MKVSEIMNAPLPQNGCGRPKGRGRLVTPIQALNVGQCVYFEVEDGENARVLRCSITGVISKISREQNRKYTTRKINDTQIGVWRVL